MFQGNYTPSQGTKEIVFIEVSKRPSTRDSVSDEAPNSLYKINLEVSTRSSTRNFVSYDRLQISLIKLN